MPDHVAREEVNVVAIGGGHQLEVRKETSSTPAGDELWLQILHFPFPVHERLRRVLEALARQKGARSGQATTENVTESFALHFHGVGRQNALASAVHGGSHQIVDVPVVS